MKKKRLGQSNLVVSELCLGSMTWGTQNTAKEGHTQIDMALERGVNFIDTAEMYPVNLINAKKVGRTERIIGLWFDRSHRRSDVILATKHSGIGFNHARDGAPISAKTISEAVDGSLRRLKTEYIDLYQFHWPNRGSYMFRQNWSYDPSAQNRATTLEHMEEALDALQAQVKRGTIRAFGLSNESAWGATQWVNAAERTGGPRAASIQNEYSLLCRLYDTDLAEVSANENIGLLAFSPLAAGLLSGKYQNGAIPEKSRMTLVPELGGRNTPRAIEAVQVYLSIAQKHGLDPVQMALAWCISRPFMGSVIFGATTLKQLNLALGAQDLTLSDEVLIEIDAAHRLHPLPY